MTTTLDYFLLKLKDHVDEKDANIMDNILNSSYADWKEGNLSGKCSTLIKKYYNVDVDMTPIVIPSCWGGIIIALMSHDKVVLEGIIEQLDLDRNEVKINQ